MWGSRHFFCDRTHVSSYFCDRTISQSHVDILQPIVILHRFPASLRSQLISHTDMMVCFLSWKNITFLLVETIKAVVVKKCDLQSLGSLQEVLNKSIDDFPGGLGVGEDVSDELLSQIVIFNVKHLGGLYDNSDHNNINAEGQGHLIKVNLHLRGALLLSVQGLELTNWWYGDNLPSPSPPPSPWPSPSPSPAWPDHTSTSPPWASSWSAPSGERRTSQSGTSHASSQCPPRFLINFETDRWSIIFISWSMTLATLHHLWTLFTSNIRISCPVCCAHPDI